MIQERIRQGVYVKDIAAELGVHPRMVSRALKRGGSPPGQRPTARKSRLDRYKPVIDRLLAAGVWTAAVILREIQEQGYSGQASILRDYIRPKRPLHQLRTGMRLGHGPSFESEPDLHLDLELAAVLYPAANCLTSNNLYLMSRDHFRVLILPLLVD